MGSTAGHVVPGSCFLLASLSLIYLSISRALKSPPPLSSHLPERSPRILFFTGCLMVFFCSAGIALEAIGCVVTCSEEQSTLLARLFFQGLHETLYFSFLSVGITFILESRRLLPLDTGRKALALCLLANSGLWSSHASMQSGAEKAQHELLSEASLFAALVTALSVSFPKDMFLHLAVQVSLALIGGWLLLIAPFIVKGGTSMKHMSVAPTFFFLGAVLTLVSLCVAALVTHVKRRRGGGRGVGRGSEVESGSAGVPLRASFSSYKKVAKGEGEAITRVMSNDGLL